MTSIENVGESSSRPKLRIQVDEHKESIDSGTVARYQMIMLSIAVPELASLKLKYSQDDKNNGSGYWDIVKRLLYVYQSLV